MPRPFSLEALLRIRQHREDAEEQALTSINTHRLRIEETLFRLQQELRHWTDDRIRDAGQSKTGAFQAMDYVRLNVLRDATVQLEGQLEDVVVRWKERQATYLAARSARETLSELKKAEKDASDLQQQRREQRRLEDLFLARFSR
jgi:flagellar export protein FliJ